MILVVLKITFCHFMCIKSEVLDDGTWGPTSKLLDMILILLDIVEWHNMTSCTSIIAFLWYIYIYDI